MKTQMFFAVSMLLLTASCDRQTGSPPNEAPFRITFNDGFIEYRGGVLFGIAGGQSFSTALAITGTEPLYAVPLIELPTLQAHAFIAPRKPFALSEFTWKIESTDAGGAVTNSGYFRTSYSLSTPGFWHGPDGVPGTHDDVVRTNGSPSNVVNILVVFAPRWPESQKLEKVPEADMSGTNAVKVLIRQTN